MKNNIICFILCSLILAVSAAQAHEFIIKPVGTPQPGWKSLGFSVVSAHVFMTSEDMEPLDHVAVSVFNEKGSFPAELRENPMLMTLDGQAPLAGDQGYTLLYGHRKPLVYSKTVQGWIEGGKKGDKGVISCKKYEKFCKTLVRSGSGTEGFDRKAGCPLEIMPKMSPAEVKPGMEMPLTILYNGKPVEAEVLATYDGFSGRPNTWAGYTKSGEDGNAWVKITRPGLWMVRVEKEVTVTGSDTDNHSMRSVLVFDIR